MVYRTVICGPLLVAAAAMLLACGLFTDGVEKELPLTEPSPSGAQGATPAQSARAAFVSPPSRPIDSGLATMEWLIVENSLIVKARLSSVRPGAMTDEDGGHRAVLKFNFTVTEHLKGTSATNVVGIWVYGRTDYATSAEAESMAETLMTARDTQWDNREAVVLLNASIPLTAQFLQEPNHYFMARGHSTSFPDDDFYSLYSNKRRGLLPSTDGDGNSGDSQEFLLALPEPPVSNAATPRTTRRRSIPPGGDLSNGRTITLGALMGIIKTVTDEYNGGDGSEAYKKCVLDKYDHLTLIRNSPTVYGNSYTALGVDHTLDSGQAAGIRVSDVVIDTKYVERDTYYQTIERMWLTGTDALHFETFAPPVARIDEDNDGTFDKLRVEYGVKTVRPLPGGSYEFTVHESRPRFAICNFVIEHGWTVTATDPAGTVHELFFDPVTVSTAVAADSTNGVLKPASFTDANGASATLNSISYESGTVTIGVSPDDALAGHVLDFIELDGTVSLSLDVADATVDAANDTLSWTVASQPWDDGDLLMVRIR